MTDLLLLLRAYTQYALLARGPEGARCHWRVVPMGREPGRTVLLLEWVYPDGGALRLVTASTTN
jgi:hypothetical protein